MITVVSNVQYNLEEVINSFEKRWNEKFILSSRESQCKLFEELVFGQQVSPQDAQKIVDTIVSNKRLFQ
ncbi:MAG: hypothetical protein II670_07555 [Alphaproteobacteria bacterium]|nr:hypothetical protein [Alphaproteobacteria bacterium]